MKTLKEFLEKIVAEGVGDPTNECCIFSIRLGRLGLAQHIISEYLTDSKQCQCELCKKQHQLIQEEK